jgi:GTP cyclohydrolase IB
MKDVQGQEDTRQLPIDQVGITDVHYPIVVLDKNREKQQTLARFTMSVLLPQEFKGTHMSRFIELLDSHRGEITMRTMPSLLDDMRTKLAAAAARVEVRFPYFLERSAPVSGARALMDYECGFIGEAKESSRDFVLSVKVPVTSLCPCSKAISDYGAHNQRGWITMDVKTRLAPDNHPELLWIEDLIDIAERSASAPVYPLLKRADERHVTMQAYDNPVFVEDMVRNVAKALRDDERVVWFRVHALNQESIHNHGAFAQIEWARE